jgi:hypothetical protein
VTVSVVWRPPDVRPAPLRVVRAAGACVLFADAWLPSEAVRELAWPHLSPGERSAWGRGRFHQHHDGLAHRHDDTLHEALAGAEAAVGDAWGLRARTDAVERLAAAVEAHAAAG